MSTVVLFLTPASLFLSLIQPASYSQILVDLHFDALLKTQLGNFYSLHKFRSSHHHSRTLLGSLMEPRIWLCKLFSTIQAFLWESRKEDARLFSSLHEQHLFSNLEKSHLGIQVLWGIHKFSPEFYLGSLFEYLLGDADHLNDLALN